MQFKKLLFLILFFSIFLLVGCDFTSRTTFKEDFGLSSVKDGNELKKLLKTNWSSYDRANGGVGAPEMDDSVEDGQSGSTEDYTKTNVQVEGVDEGDIVKTDGRRIYSIKYDRLQVVGILGNGQMELLLNDQIQSEGDLNYSNFRNTYYSELYVTDKYLVVIGQRYQYDYYLMDDKESDAVEPARYYYSTSMSVVSLYDINTLEKVDEYQMSGYLLGSRLIDNNLYLMSNHYTYNYYDNTDYDPRPYTVHNEELQYVEYNDIKYLPDTVHESFTTITKVSLNSDVTYDNDVFLGSSSWGQIYVSKNAIYLATSYYVVDNVFTDSWSYKSKLISYQFDENGNVIYGGAGDYEGHVINQFAMDEYNGYMRIATTEGWGDSIKNRLYVFERKLVDNVYTLKVVGSITEGLGKPRESIRSVRFNQDKATVVTYEQTDPFYTIDLSDPTKPTIKGELEVPGFSVYQHPWKDNLVIGIGYDAVGNSINGMKLSLYDISDIENPVEVGAPLLLSNQNSWSYSEALWNHKAILVDNARNFLGFSLYRSDWNDGKYSSMNEYIVFEVDENSTTPIQIKHTVNHYDYYANNTELFRDSWYYSFTIDRAVRIGDYLYVVSGEVITSHNLTGTFGTVDNIIFAQE